MLKIGFPKLTAKNRFQILNLQPKKHISYSKNKTIKTWSYCLKGKKYQYVHYWLYLDDHFQILILDIQGKVLF